MACWCSNHEPDLARYRATADASGAAGAPEWSLLGIAHLAHLPGIRSKLHNLEQLQKTDAKRFAAEFG